MVSELGVVNLSLKNIDDLLGLSAIEIQRHFVSVSIRVSMVLWMSRVRLSVETHAISRDMYEV